jgi:hypothetical protein
MMTPKFLTLLAAGAAALSINTAMAHGPEKPKFSGTVATAGELGFELAQQGDAVVLYVEDHGKPKSTEGMSGKLTVLNGADKSEADLTPLGDNKLAAKGIKVAPGSKAVAALTLPDKKVLTVRFTVK